MRNLFLVLALAFFLLSPATPLFAAEDAPSERTELSIVSLVENSIQQLLQWFGWGSESSSDENHCTSCCDGCGDPSDDDPGMGPVLVPGGEPDQQPEG